MEFHPTVLSPPDNGDEVARQRRKRIAAVLDRPVAGFDDVRLGDVMTSLAVAVEESPAPLDARLFLTERGYDGPTVETVLAYFSLLDDDVVSGAT